MRPVNIASKKPYRGINVLALWATAEEKGYTSGTWGTYRQWSEIGAQVKKGEKATFIVFYKELEYAADSEAGDTETTTRLFARATPVFAAEQVDGYQLPAIDAPPATIITPIEQAEIFVAATGAAISHGGGRAFYRPSTSACPQSCLCSSKCALSGFLPKWRRVTRLLGLGRVGGAPRRALKIWLG